MTDTTRGTPGCRSLTPGGRGGVVGPAAVFLVASLSAWLRLTPVTRATMWAEDGKYLHDALRGGGPAILLHPNGGYLQLEPRLVNALVTAVVPVAGYAVVITAAACRTAGACAAVVYVCSAAVTASTTARVAFAAVTVLAPMLAVKVLGTTANIHTIFLYTAPWLLLYPPRTRAAPRPSACSPWSVGSPRAR